MTLNNWRTHFTAPEIDEIELLALSSNALRKLIKILDTPLPHIVVHVDTRLTPEEMYDAIKYWKNDDNTANS
jgi:3'-phosphoadenosine 5'-phosphosulfate sulfotransferase (PAPS reductase)/FAD synthetase